MNNETINNIDEDLYSLDSILNDFNNYFTNNINNNMNNNINNSNNMYDTNAGVKSISFVDKNYENVNVSGGKRKSRRSRTRKSKSRKNRRKTSHRRKKSSSRR